MTVRSPKTAAHDGHAVRIVPITPELRPILHALFDQAPECSKAVVPRLTDLTTKLRTAWHEGKRVAEDGSILTRVEPVQRTPGTGS